MYPIIVSNSRRVGLDEKIPTLRVRYIEPQHVDGVLAIEAAAHKLGPAVSARVIDRPALMNEVARQETKVLVASADDRVVGWVLFERDGAVGRIVRLSANPRRNGYGTALLGATERLAHKGGCDKLVADVYEEDLAAQNFLKARGFKSAAVKKAAWDGPGIRFTKTIG